MKFLLTVLFGGVVGSIAASIIFALTHSLLLVMISCITIGVVVAAAEPFGKY